MNIEEYKPAIQELSDEKLRDEKLRELWLQKRPENIQKNFEEIQ